MIAYFLENLFENLLATIGFGAILTIIVFLNVMATVALWRRSRPEKLKKKFLRALRHGQPIEPKHDPPKIIGESFSSLVDESDRLFFDHFAEFADVVNRWLTNMQSPWRLQELPKTELKLASGSHDQPMFGRCYDIFHNQVRLGRLEVHPGIDYSAEDPSVYADIELQWVRLLSYDSVTELLHNIALYVCNPRRETREYYEARAAIQVAITNVLWHTQQIQEIFIDTTDYGDLELHLDGTAEFYFHIRLKNSEQKQSTSGE